MFNTQAGCPRFAPVYLVNNIRRTAIANRCIPARSAENLYFGSAGVKVFVKGCETPGSESEQLLQHSYHILKRRQSDGTAQKERKKKPYRFS